MKRIITILFMLINLFTYGQEDFFKQFEWEHRIVMVFGDASDEMVSKQIDELAKNPEEITDRDLLIFHVGDKLYEIPGKETQQQVETSYIRDQYEVSKNEFRYILLGKDGGVKYNKKSFVPNQTLFAIIDAMPMRQREMRENN